MAKLNTNGNVYTIVYAAVMVIIVAFLLAFVASALKETQDKNVALDTKKQILAALNIRDCEDADAKYNEVVAPGDLNRDTLTAVVDGQEKLIVRVKGAGLWGGIWGWVSINKDGKTVFGTFFNHESETAGLGARIKDDQSFQDAFQNKQIFDADGNVALSVLKKGKEGNLSQEYVVEAVTGATLTSNGVNDMIQAGLKKYADVIKAFAGGETANIPEVEEYEKVATIDKPIEPTVEEMED
ncbi:MAG: FMN-binding protein [Bacteroidaceae bacterium]|jgi:Na+-transporting NADH:ubiquinone oxidoreductase subunit C|nr:FMN-binding protein [Bacteroidaceae bacterium]MCR5132325.1 FMN-binding protein [Prevotella sp.]